MSAPDTVVTLGVLNPSSSSGSGHDRLRKMTQWYDNSWKFRKSLSISSGIVSGSEALLDFPFEVRTTDSDFAKHAQGTGNDFLFTAADGQTKLDHEIRYWNPSTGRLVAIVKIPILSPTEATVVFLYYGNPECSDQQNKKGLWAEYLHHQYFRLDPAGDDRDTSNIVQGNHGTPMYVVFLKAQKKVLEDLFGTEWFRTDARKRSQHPAFMRWRLCELLLQREGAFRLPKERLLLPELGRAILENLALVQCTKGDITSFSLGSVANYGDHAVQRRLQSEIAFPSEYLDIQSELQWAAWHLQQGHSVTAYETAGVDHRIDIPGWSLPILSDCKRIAEATSPGRVREVIKKANRQIKRHNIPSYGITVIDVSEKVPLYDISSLSDDFPAELVPYKEEVSAALRTHYKSVTAVVLYWNEVAVLGSMDSPGRILLSLRTRSELLQHEHPRYPFASDQDNSGLLIVGEVSFSIMLRPRDP